ncbi:unnamed protein product [Closterium sp. Naga37s-1]|nr:unnamed protein product [Closterium sp. Naga37s-1]
MSADMAQTADVAEAADWRVLITFDVDGTLVHSVGSESNKLHKRAFAHAMKKVFGIHGTIDAIQHHGSTDQAVLINTLEFYGIPRHISEPQLPVLCEAMLQYCQQHAGDAADGIALLPGVRVLLEELSRMQPRVVVGLVTGNLEPIAWLKMAGLEVDSLFTTPRIGGFGSDHMDRGELVRIARQRANERIAGPPFRLHAHVGDTPNDIIAARFGGAKPIGVCTGIFSRAELLAVLPPCQSIGPLPSGATGSDSTCADAAQVTGAEEAAEVAAAEEAAEASSSFAVVSGPPDCDSNGACVGGSSRGTAGAVLHEAVILDSLECTITFLKACTLSM